MTGHQLDAATREEDVVLLPGASGHSVAALGAAVVRAAPAVAWFENEELTRTSG